VEVIDYAGHWPQEYLDALWRSRITSKTVFVGFSDTWGLAKEPANRFNNLILEIKKQYPAIKTIVGSQNLTATKINADYYIEGYGEYALMETIKHMLGTIAEKLKYTLFRNGKLIRGSDYPAVFMQDLSVRYEPRDFIKPNEQLGLELSRGCKFQCDFCNYFPLNVKGDNFRAVDNYIDNLKYLHDEFGVSTFFGADSTMNVNNEKLELFGDATAKLSWKPWICAFTRADLLITHTKYWDAMIAMGYVSHHYGLETFNHASGKSIGKGMHPDKIKTGLLKVKEYFGARSDYRATISLIAGLPYETMGSIKSGIQWIYDNLPDEHVVVYPLFIPHPEYSDQTQKSLFSKDHTHYGYRDTTENIDTLDWDKGMKWVNDQTGTSHDQVTQFVATDPMIRDHSASRTPWLIGELCQMADIDRNTALGLKFKPYEAYTVYADGAKQIVQNYIRDKLNYV
jgi:radical SAM superfamily enzyme YgiQ (UPF0313 family)